MMSENELQILQSLKILCIAGFSAFYGFGGVKGKYKRRILGPIYLTSCLIGFSLWQGVFNWAYLLFMPILYAALSSGYGGDNKTVLQKIGKRARYGLLVALASLPIAIVTGAWFMFGVHVVLCVGISVVLGVWNPISARGEETLIGTVSGLLPLFYLG